MTSVADQVREYIESDILEGGSVPPLTNETELWDEEVIDSMGIMMLISYIETEHDVFIAADDVDVENFKTVNRIAALIEGKQG